MTLDYTKTTQKPFPEVLAAIQREAESRNFRTLHVHDVQATLAEKGFSIGPYSIVEVCNAGFANTVINAHKPVGMMLPCRILLYTDGPDTVVSLMLPTLIAAMMPEADFGDVPRTVERALIEAVDSAVPG